MILYLSSAFLIRLRMMWKPDLSGFLLGDRNFYFFAPDSFIEVPEISQEQIDGFLREKMADPQEWELLGFISHRETPPIPGYVQVWTGASKDPEQWEAILYFLEDSRPVAKKLQIKLPST